MNESVIPLLIVVPLLSAPLVFLISSKRVRWLVAVLATGFTLVASVLLLNACLEQGVLSYPMGNWPPPIGIEYRIDLLSSYFLCFISLIGFVSLLASREFIKREIEPARQQVFIAAFLLLISGLCGIVITGDIFNIFVFLEISSLSTYTLIALGRDPRGLVASFRYLLVGTVGTTLFLIGIGLLYALTGTLNLHDLGERLSDMPVGRVYQCAMACIVLGTAIKAAIVPFHLWLPPCYSFAPSIVTVFLSAAATKTSLYILYRIGLTVSGWEVFYNQLIAGEILFWASCFAVVFCPWQALRQTNVKMILAWSSLGQIGYISLALALATDLGRQASMVQIFSHAIIKSTLFLSLALLTIESGRATLSALTGMGHKKIFAASIFSVAALGLAGIPLTSGFISKWYLYNAAVGEGLWIAVLAIVAGSLLGLLYVARMLSALWATSAADQPAAVTATGPSRDWLITAVLLFLGVFIVYLGINPGELLELTELISTLPE